MSQSDSNARLDHDPLLEFVIEPNRAPAVPDPPVPAQKSGDAALSPPSTTVNATDDVIAGLTTRLAQLERTAEKTAKQIASLSSDVATLVNAHRDIRRRLDGTPVKRPASQAGRAPLTSAAAAAVGLLLAVACAVWVWSSPARDDVAASTSPGVVDVVAAAESPAPPEPAQATPVPAVVQVRHRAPREQAPALFARYQGTLSIDASPQAEVFINRRPAGRTPLRLPAVKAGSHLVWLQRDGYQRFTRVVMVPADRVTRVSATLEPIATR